MYTGKLDDIVGEYNNTYSRTIKIKYIDVKTSTYIDDHVKISKYKNNFAKGYTSNWSEEVFVIKKIKTLYHRNV